MGNTSFEILLNEENITNTLLEVNATNTASSLVNLERTTESSLAISFRNGASVSLTASFGILSFVATLPQEFQGNTTGLMGNFNDDPTDDLMYPNGSLLVNATDREIHFFGQSCEHKIHYNITYKILYSPLFQIQGRSLRKRAFSPTLQECL